MERGSTSGPKILHLRTSRDGRLGYYRPSTLERSISRTDLGPKRTLNRAYRTFLTYLNKCRLADDLFTELIVQLGKKHTQTARYPQPMRRKNAQEREVDHST